MPATANKMLNEVFFISVLTGLRASSAATKGRCMLVGACKQAVSADLQFVNICFHPSSTGGVALDSRSAMKRAPIKILVVDDDRRTRTLLQSYLQEMGFIVATAADGEQLETILARQKIDLLVLDLMLPGEDGLTLCRRLRGTGVELPIIMLTAKGGDV